MAKIPLARPYIPTRSKELLDEVIESGQLTEGPVTRQLEMAVENYIEVNYAIAVPNATLGLEMALRAFGVGNGDKVLVPDFTYPATALAVFNVGADPILVDVDEDTMLMNMKHAFDLAHQLDIKAIVPVSIFGNPIDPFWYKEIKKDRRIAIIEDAACSFGSEIDGKRVGSIADATVFSFHPRKTITCGEGGMITTNSYLEYEYMKRLKCFGLYKGIFNSGGTNHKVSDILSAILLGQVEEIDDILHDRERSVDEYKGYFAPYSDIKVQWHSWYRAYPSYQSFVIKVPNRDKVMKALRDRDIECQIGTYAIHRTTWPLNQQVHYLPNSSRLYNSVLALPLYSGMYAKDIRKVAQTVIVNL